MKTVEQIESIAVSLIDRDKDRNKDYEDYERMYHNDWSLPPELAIKAWMFSIMSTDPAIKINSATRVLATLQPSLKMQPLYSNQETKELANIAEKVLSWNLWSASKRRATTIWWDYAQSAVLYHMIAAQVIDLDYQIKQHDMFGADSSRLKAARRFGRFMVNVYNPKCVHPRYSDVMQEGVLLEQTKTAYEIYKELGPVVARKLKSYAESKEPVALTLYDYVDYEGRMVWCYPKDGGEKLVLIEPSDIPFPFINWTVRTGGTTLEMDEREKYKPLLYTILRAGQWEIANVAESIITSRAIAASGFPLVKEEGQMMTNSTEVNYDDPLMKVDVTPGNTLTPMQPPTMDVNMLALRDDIRRKMSGAVPDVLQTLQPETGEAYASFSLRVASAIGVLAPYRKLAEDALADTAELMLLWAHYTKKDLYSYGTGKEDKGTQYSIAWDSIPPDALYISCEFRPDTPTDKIGKINAASMAVQALGMSREFALEEIGVDDPQQEMRKGIFERLLQNKIDLQIQREQMQASLEFEQMKMEAQAEMQAQQQMAIQQTQNMSGPQGIPGISGEAFNPAMGGQVPAQVMAEATREQQMGMTRSGLPAAEIIA